MTGNLFGITTDYGGSFLELFFHLAWRLVIEMKRPYIQVCEVAQQSRLKGHRATKMSALVVEKTSEAGRGLSFSSASSLTVRGHCQNAILGKCSQNVHDIARFRHFIDLNLFKYVANVICNWETDALQFYFMVLFLLLVMVKGDESSGLRMAN